MAFNCLKFPKVKQKYNAMIKNRIPDWQNRDSKPQLLPKLAYGKKTTIFACCTIFIQLNQRELCPWRTMQVCSFGRISIPGKFRLFTPDL